MKRTEAVDILKQILEGSSSAQGKSLTLLLHPKNGLSKGFQIQLNCGDDEILFAQVEKIVNRNNLAVKRDGMSLIVYRPQNQ